jgi:hypothetical protein
MNNRAHTGIYAKQRTPQSHQANDLSKSNPTENVGIHDIYSTRWAFYVACSSHPTLIPCMDSLLTLILDPYH